MTFLIHEPNKAIKINVDANYHKGKTNDERTSIKCNNVLNINDHKGKTNEERAAISNNNTNCKKNIVIVGDSIVNNIDAKGVGRNHNIKVRCYGGEQHHTGSH